MSDREYGIPRIDREYRFLNGYLVQIWPRAHGFLVEVTEPGPPDDGGPGRPPMYGSTWRIRDEDFNLVIHSPLDVLEVLNEIGNQSTHRWSAPRPSSPDHPIARGSRPGWDPTAHVADYVEDD